ncbi:MAG: VOC family protein [Actinomycetota bacterium]
MLEGLKNIEHLGIYSKNTKKLADWYSDVLGMEVAFKISKDLPEKSIYFLKGADGTVVEILPSNNKDNARDLDDPGYSHIGITVDNFDKAAKALKDKGVVLKNVRNTSIGWTIGYFNDPDGNILEIVYRPKGGKI